MQGFLAGGTRAGPAVDHSIAPANLDTSIVQPTDPIVKYCFSCTNVNAEKFGYSPLNKSLQ
jgi:hypothetical protein